MNDRYDESGEITKPAHKSDHAFVHELEKKYKKSQELKEKIATSVLIAFVWFIISGIGAIMWYAFTERIDKQ